MSRRKLIFFAGAGPWGTSARKVPLRMLPLRWPVVAVEIRTEGRVVGLQSSARLERPSSLTTRALFVARDG